MFSLKQFFGKGQKFFILLESAAQETVDSVNDLAAFMEAPPSSRQPDIISAHRDREGNLSEKIREELVCTFVTELDRDDIESLADAFYRIPKAVDLFARHVIAAGSHVEQVDFSHQIKLMRRAAETMLDMTMELRHLNRLERAQTLYRKLRRLDAEAEEHRMELIGELYSGHYPPICALAIRDLYGLCEKIMSRCAGAGQVLMHIFLKNN